MKHKIRNDNVDNKEKVRPKKLSRIKALSKESKIIITMTSLTVVFISCVSYFVYVTAFGGTSKSSKPNNMLVAHAQQVTSEDTTTVEPKTGLIGSFDDFIPSSEEDKKINILILGVDARQDTLTGRSDAVIAVTLDTETGILDMVSIPRDSYVEIVGKGMHDKITHAFAYGGVDMAKATVENLLGTTFDHYVVVNFTSVTRVIDALGGIEVEVPFAFTEKDSKDKHNAISFEEGVQTLNGEEALAYARMRKQDPRGDIGRGERQQQVIEATIQKMKDTNSISTYIDVFNTVRKSIDTDIGITDITKLTPDILGITTTTNHSLTGKGAYIDGIYYYQLDDSSLEEVKTLFQESEDFEEQAHSNTPASNTTSTTVK